MFNFVTTIMDTNIPLKKISKYEKYLAILLIAIVTILAYGLLINSFGYYSDEWYVLWAGQTSGPGLIVDYHQFDRPLMGYFYALYYIVLGDNPLGWQILAVFLRLVGVLAFWWTLRMVWPKSLLATTSAALLFAVYPGFLVMPKAGVKVNHLFSLASALISIAFTVKSVQVKQLWKVAVSQLMAFLFGTIYLFYVEYMIGLEFYRWIFLWIAIKDSNAGHSLKRRFQRWILYIGPIILVIIGMVGWRLFAFESGRQAMNVGSISQKFVVNPLYSLAGLLIETIRDFIETAFSAWFVQGYSMTAGAPYSPWVISVILMMSAAILYLGYSQIIKKSTQNDPAGEKTNHLLLWIGALGMIAALFPLVVVGRQVYLDSSKFNKYTIHASIGASSMIIGFLMAFVRRKGVLIIVSALLCLAIQTHYFNGLRYQEDWQYQKELWWQLTWRAPDLQDGTLLTARLPSEISYSENYQVWAPANIIYRPNSEAVTITGEILTSETLDWFRKGKIDQKSIRGVTKFDRNFNNTLILTIPNSISCLHIIDGNRIEDYREHFYVQLIYDKSRIDQIITDTDLEFSPPIEIFGPEPEHEWCYYYQKISLSNQREDWEDAVFWADEAAKLGYEPYNRSEWIPAFESYAHLNKIDKAISLAKLIQKDKGLKDLYCQQPVSNNELAFSLICENN